MSEKWTAEKALGELLAVIHCDGGHYQLKYGITKAIEDAIDIIYKLREREQNAGEAVSVPEEIWQWMVDRNIQPDLHEGECDIADILEALNEHERMMSYAAPAQAVAETPLKDAKLLRTLCEDVPDMHPTVRAQLRRLASNIDAGAVVGRLRCRKCGNSEEITVHGYSRPAQAVAPARYREFAKFYAKLGDVFGRRFPHCRDCADEDGTCPQSGLPCEWPKLPPFTHVFTPALAVSVPDVKAMAYRFMGWKFPKDIYPDGGLKLDRDYLDRYPELWPTGTNLLHLGQAEEMVRYMLASAPTAPAGDGEDHA